jgi:hypothetical protein
MNSTVMGTGGEMVANTCSNTDNLDTKISVYTGNCDNKLSCLSANDNFCGTQSAAAWMSNLGETYYILLHVDEDTVIDDPTFEISIVSRYNGQCEFAIGPDLAAISAVQIGDTTDGLPVGIECNATVDNSPGAWYKMRGTGGEHLISVCDSVSNSYEPKVTIVLADDCLQDLTCLVTTRTQDDCAIFFTSTPFEDYFIVVSGYTPESSGSFGLQVLEMEPPPPNDNIDNN